MGPLAVPLVGLKLRWFELSLPLRWQGVLRRAMPSGNHCLALLYLEEASSRPPLPKAAKTSILRIE